MADQDKEGKVLSAFCGLILCILFGWIFGLAVSITFVIVGYLRGYNYLTDGSYKWIAIAAWALLILTASINLLNGGKISPSPANISSKSKQDFWFKSSTFNSKETHVRSYRRKNGTYVKAYDRRKHR